VLAFREWPLQENARVGAPPLGAIG